MNTILRSLMALVAVGMMVVSEASPVFAAGSCGNGIVSGGEECDGGPELFVNGDPANDPCTTGSTCYFKFTCCKFNCQFVGTGVPCQDGDNCSGPDKCNQVGHCVGGPNALDDGTPCDDGLFCTGVDTCQNGVCSSAGDPCSGAACQHCQEATDNCFDPAASTCSFNGDSCVTGGTCDGAGACVGGVFNSDPCDDGIFCNGTDSCQGGACHIHTGDPCPGPDGDANCSESCNENADACTAADTDGAHCDDGLFCNGSNVDVCSGGSCVAGDTPQCDDDNSCTADICDEILGCTLHITALDGTNCDDEALCSLNDQCSGGVCIGDEAVTGDFCPWTLLIRENEKKDRIKTGFSVQIDGDMCGGTLMVGGKTDVSSDIVADEAEGTGQLRIAPDATIGEDLVSAGGGAKAFPGSGKLPYVLPLSQTLPPNSLTAKSDASGFYDLTGTHELVADCHAARTAYGATTAALDALTPTAAAMEAIKLGPTATQIITAGIAGGLNVIDVDGGLSMSPDSTLELNGAGNADSVMILRINGKMKMLLRTTLSLTNGLSPEHTLLYVKGKKCQISDLSLGGGTLLCSPGRVKTGRLIVWIGTVYSDGKQMKIGDKSAFTYDPFTGY